MTKVLSDNKVNIVSDVFINDKFSDNADVQSLGTWKIDVDTTNGEIDFASSDEAGHFAEVINKLYFKTNSPDKRGLVTIKTNIEVLTTQALQSGTADTFYSQPKQLTIGSGTGIALPDLGTDSTAIDTFFIDYSLVGQALDSSNSSITRYYNQVGTLVYNANPLSQTDANGNVSGSVTLQDVSSSSHDYHANGNVYYSGSVEFNEPANGTVSITADNNVTPTSNVVMKYSASETTIVINNVRKKMDVDRRLTVLYCKNANTEKDVLEAFSTVKIHSRYLDYYSPKSWMKPFEIIENGYFCTTGISILMYNILSNLKFIEPCRTSWKVISNHVTGKDGAIFIFDGFAYNLIPGEKVLFEKSNDYIVLQDLKDITIPII